MADEQVSRRRVLKGATAAGALGLAAAVPMAALAPGAAFARSDDSIADPLVGAWRGPASLTGGPSVETLTSFAAGGSLVQSSSIDLQPASLTTPGYGAWKRTGPGKYAINFLWFTFDPKENPSGSGQLKSKNITLDDNVLRGPFTFTLFDTKGTILFTASGSLRTTRIEADA
jgi:hypothetical protein